MPTVYPPHFFDLEFTEKFEPLAISVPIGVNRLISAACVAMTVFPPVQLSFKYRQRSGKRGPVVRRLSRSHANAGQPYAPFKTQRIATFDGASWTLTGEPLSAD
jgi:hypothetical protein